MSFTPPPRRLFKYRPVESKYTESIFINRSLYFSAPAKFNDPFDCNLPLRFEGTEQEWFVFLNVFIGEDQSISTTDKDDAVARLMAKKPWVDPSPFQSILESNRIKIRERSSVLCWATEPDNVLMFAYYANGHNGICLEFEVGLEHEIGRAVPVCYPPDYPDLNYIRVHKNIADILIFRKAPFWAHERELRVFRPGVMPGEVRFPCHLLKRVIFGSNATCEVIQTVKRWCQGWESALYFAQAKPAKDRFMLTIEDFDKL